MTLATRCPSCRVLSVVDPDFPHPDSPAAPHLLHHAPTCTADQREHFILDCGCQGWIRGPEVGGEFVYDPCGDDQCEFYRYVLVESGRQGNRLEMRPRP